MNRILTLLTFILIKFNFPSSSQMIVPVQLQQSKMKNQGMQQPQMRDQGMQQPQMGSQGMQQPQMGGQDMQQSQLGGQGQTHCQIRSQKEQAIFQLKNALRACYETIKNFYPPHQCCQYPFMGIAGTKAASCLNDCKNFPDKFCTTKCVVKNLVLYDENNKMQARGWADFFIAGLTEFNIPRRNWPEIIENSAKKCADALSLPENKFITEHKQLNENYPAACILHANFVACPQLVDNEMCKKTHQFFSDPQSCYTKYGIYYSFETFWFPKEMSAN